MLEMIVTNLPILICLVLGLIFLIIEVFMPGFGLPGIAGVVLEGASIVMTFLKHGGLAALVITLIILGVVAIAISVALRKLPNSSVILNETESVAEGYVAVRDMEVFLGKEGHTTTVLRPTGMAEFDGVKLNVQADGEYIPKDVPVRVERVEGARVVVRRMTTESSSNA